MRITYPGLGKLIPSSFRATYANSCGARARGRAYCAVSIGISVVWLAQGIRPLVCEIVAFGVPRTHAAVRLERHQARADERGPTLRLWTRPSSGKHPCCPSVFMAAEGQQAPTSHDDRIVLPTPSGRTKVRPQRGASVSRDRRVHPHIASSLERAPRQRKASVTLSPLAINCTRFCKPVLAVGAPPDDDRCPEYPGASATEQPQHRSLCLLTADLRNRPPATLTERGESRGGLLGAGPYQDGWAVCARHPS